jgi:DNA-directed RNA polymerase subunit RPC12/RpoP
MDVSFQCIHCNQSLESSDDMVGEYIRCPNCGRLISIPKPTIPAIPEQPITNQKAIAQTPVPSVAPVVPIVQILAQPAPLQASGMAIASMVIGILGIVGGWMCCGFILPILAIIFGHISFSRIAKNPTVLTGKGMAITGFTLGYVGLLIGIIGVFVFGTYAVTMGALLEAMNKIFEQVPGQHR